MAAGVDEESITGFDKDLKNNLYKIWNRMSSGGYFLPAMLLVEITKKGGALRKLGVPTVSDRIAQMVAKTYFEPEVDHYFHLNYRAMSAFRCELSRLWFRTLRRRSQKTRLNWDRMSRLE